MSKKLFIILITSVLAIGIIATGIVWYFQSPVTRAKLAVKNSQNSPQSITLVQENSNILISSKSLFVTKTEQGFLINSQLKTLNQSPKGELYTTQNQTYVDNSFSPITFNFKAIYFTDKVYSNENAEVFSAKVKPKFMHKFLGDRFLNGMENLTVTVVFNDKTASTITLNYTYQSDNFTLTIEY